MLLFGGVTLSSPSQRMVNENVSRWRAEYTKVLARRSARNDIDIKQVEAKEPTATTENGGEISTPAKSFRVQPEEFPSIMGPEEISTNKDIIAQAIESHPPCESLPEPTHIDLNPKKRQKTAAVETSRSLNGGTTTTSRQCGPKPRGVQIGDVDNDHRTQPAVDSEASLEPPTYAPPRKVSSHDADSVYKERRVIKTADTPHRRPAHQINRAHLQELNVVKSYIQKVIQTSINGQGDVAHDSTILRHHIQKLEYFENVNELLIDRSHVLKEEGLPRIYSSGNKHYFPEDIIVDAKRLVRRWAAGHFDASIDRGIKHEKLDLGQGKTRWSHSLKIVGNGVHNHRAADFQGHNGLDNGQWWYSRLAALRDGAHGEAEAGIFGATTALAIALSATGYANIDNGDEIEYVGTPGEKGEPSRGTKLLDSSFRNRLPVRVLRSVNKGSKYAPKAGIRYDGLYRIVSMKVLNPDRLLNSYKLRRLPGQTPIRYEGPAIRPSVWELRRLDLLKGRFN